MPLQNILQGNYNTGKSSYQIKLPIELGIKIADNDPVRLLDSFVDAMELTELNNSYGRHVKKTASPVKLFKIVVFGMMKKSIRHEGYRKPAKRTLISCSFWMDRRCRITQHLRVLYPIISANVQRRRCRR